MRRDIDGLMVSETSNWPGNIGDSCANTARSEVLNPTPTYAQQLHKFVTPTGFIRHPSAPEGWRESDFSGDQMMPLFLAGDDQIKGLIRARNPYAAGNGQLHSPLMWALMRGFYTAANIFLWLQLVLLTRVPYRWSDRDGLKWYQRFERTENSSADWLNWFCACVYLKRRGKLRINVPTEKVAAKVFAYYENEPNNTQVLLDYEKGFELWE